MPLPFQQVSKKRSFLPQVVPVAAGDEVAAAAVVAAVVAKAAAVATVAVARDVAAAAIVAIAIAVAAARVAVAACSPLRCASKARLPFAGVWRLVHPQGRRWRLALPPPERVRFERDRFERDRFERDRFERDRFERDQRGQLLQQGQPPEAEREGCLLLQEQQVQREREERQPPLPREVADRGVGGHRAKGQCDVA